MTINGRNDIRVFGSGFVKRRGSITRISSTIKGYRDKGRTRVPPPMLSGKKGKLLIGRVTRKRIQQTFEICPIILFTFLEEGVTVIDTLYE
jgi:hypothetical protein